MLSKLLRQDACKDCQHVIAKHEFTFDVVDDYQEYSMTCLLCGNGSAEVSVMPVDPRKASELF